ncbi:Coatomer subunit beta' [Neolecta irregularis DAH-3]|uniref:Beta'-coat protein n=1 Tax=Neolecta irregularis (strain DAH-3) TaxID=1198029 RepID=A0A1U7LJF8_NEOID|nr:Coatomer subunit beta' [Neolecta irregularis DAH-3]|eukprot:OLL22779.1 Coatomer subunit beta' [Neolecta irregularis DAH-3]
MTIKLWNWDLDWKCAMTFEGHSHYVMGLAINLKDPNTFASACLDRTVKVWNLSTSSPNYTLDAHEKGVNSVDYYQAADKPFLVTTGDDRTVKIWDYQTKALIQTLEGHTNNVSFACFHPGLPIIISGGEDGSIKIWHSSTYRLQQTLNYGLERAWCVGYLRGSNAVALGFDEGAVVVKLGREEPAVSMDLQGKIIWAKNLDVSTATIKDDNSIVDGSKYPVSARDLGSTEIYPTSLLHSPNGRFVSVCGDGEYIIYTALAWRNKSFGQAIDFVWAADSSSYATRENASTVKIFKNFKEKSVLDVPYAADGIFGGELIAVKGTGCVGFYQWETGKLVRRIDVVAKGVYWNESADLVAICSDDSFYILRYDPSCSDEFDPEEGIERSFTLLHTTNDIVSSAIFLGDAFIYTTASKLNYLVGEQVNTVTHFDGTMFLLGYLHGRVWLADKDISVSGWKLTREVLEYMTFIGRGDMDSANEMLARIDKSEINKVARFLESLGHDELALQIASDVELQFDLSLKLNKLYVAKEIAEKERSESKWRLLGDSALKVWDFVTAKEAFEKAGDLGTLLLLGTSTGDKHGLEDLSKRAAGVGKNNIAFAASLSIGDVDGCVDILMNAGRAEEAGLFAKTYGSKRLDQAMGMWKKKLEDAGKADIAARLGTLPYLRLLPMAKTTADEVEQILAKEASEYTKDLEVDRILLSFRLDAYAILDLQPGVTDADIKMAFRKKSLLIHPDKTSNPKAPDAFDLLKKAQSELEDPKIRKRLDECIEDARGILIQEKGWDIHNPLLTSDEFKYEWRTKTQEVLVQDELRRRRKRQIQMAEEGREREQAEREIEERKRRRQQEKAWEETRDGRIDSWRTFQKNGIKKGKKKQKVLG